MKMFREVRRKDRLIAKEQCFEILKKAGFGVLALSGDGGYPYGVPLNYVFDGGKIFFHCAKEGHKIDAIRRDPKASFCVVAGESVSPKEYTTYYESVIVFGKVRIIDDESEMLAAVKKLAQKYAPDNTREEEENEINKFRAALCMLEMTIEHISGKSNKL